MPVLLAMVTGTSILSPCVTSVGSFGSTVRGRRDSIGTMTEPSRPSSVCPAASTWNVVTESESWKLTSALPSFRTSTGCQ